MLSLAKSVGTERAEYSTLATQLEEAKKEIETKEASLQAIQGESECVFLDIPKQVLGGFPLGLGLVHLVLQKVIAFIYIICTCTSFGFWLHPPFIKYVYWSLIIGHHQLELAQQNIKMRELGEELEVRMEELDNMRTSYEEELTVMKDTCSQEVAEMTKEAKQTEKK